MPPLPVTSDLDPQSQLANIHRRLNDLRTFQLPRLRECKGPLDLHRELAEEMRGDLERVRLGIESCKEMGESQLRAADRLSTSRACEALEQDYLGVRAAYREALVTSKRAITASARSRRHDLLASRSANGGSQSSALDAQESLPSRTEMGGDDALQSKTNEVTDALRRTTTLMQAELERSVLSVQMLDESTNTLRLTQTLYDTYSNLLATSSHLVRALERADWYDRLLILSALVLFLAVVAWVLKKRVLDRVAGGVGWGGGGSYRLIRIVLGSSGSREKVVGGVRSAVGDGRSSVITAGIGAVNAGAVVMASKAAAATLSTRMKPVHTQAAPTPEAAVDEPKHVASTPLLDSVVPPTQETSAVLLEPGPGTQDLPRQRDEL